MAIEKKTHTKVVNRIIRQKVSSNLPYTLLQYPSSTVYHGLPYLLTCHPLSLASIYVNCYRTPHLPYLLTSHSRSASIDGAAVAAGGDGRRSRTAAVAAAARESLQEITHHFRSKRIGISENTLSSTYAFTAVER